MCLYVVDILFSAATRARVCVRVCVGVNFTAIAGNTESRTVMCIVVVNVIRISWVAYKRKSEEI